LTRQSKTAYAYTPKDLEDDASRQYYFAKKVES
jgi:hypothetical protein